MERNPLRLCAALIATVLLTVTAAWALATPAHATADTMNCSDFKKNAFPFSAAQSWYRGPYGGGPSRDYAKLDSDRDGYACEALATLTSVKGEPDCWRRYTHLGATKDCTVRDLYRQVHHLTYLGDQRATRAAIAGVYSGFAKKYGHGVKQAFDEAYLNTASKQANDCQREHMKAFLLKQHAGRKGVSVLADLFLVGEKASEAWLKKHGHPTVATVGKATRGVIGLYLEFAGKLASDAVDVSLAGAAKSQMIHGALCQP